MRRRLDIKLIRLFEMFSGLNMYDKIIIFCIVALFIGSFAITFYFPVYIWDALALYDFRAKIIAQVGFYTQIANNFFWFGGYPLFTSLSHTVVYLFGGKNPQFIYSLMYVAFVFIFYGRIREFISKRYSLLSSLILATTPVIFDHSTFAYTNLPYSIFLSLGTIYLYTWFVKQKPVGFLLLGAIMTGLSTWTRSAEPFWIVNILLLGILAVYKFKKYFVQTILYVITFLAIREPWNIVNYYILGPQEVSKPSLAVVETKSYLSTILGTTFNFGRIIEVLVFIYKNVIVSWYPLLFLFLFCVVLNVRGLLKNKISIFLLIIFIYFILLLYATYIYTFGVAYWSVIPDSARRMAMFFIPMMIYYIGLTLGQTASTTKNDK
jgi:hypothetical protein